MTDLQSSRKMYQNKQQWNINSPTASRKIILFLKHTILSFFFFAEVTTEWRRNENSKNPNVKYRNTLSEVFFPRYLFSPVIGRGDQSPSVDQKSETCWKYIYTCISHSTLKPIRTNLCLDCSSRVSSQTVDELVLSSVHSSVQHFNKTKKKTLTSSSVLYLTSMWETWIEKWRL